MYDRKFWGFEKVCLEEDYPEWRDNIAQMFRLRHDFIHHIAFKDKVGKKKIELILECLIGFIITVDYYILENYV